MSSYSKMNGCNWVSIVNDIGIKMFGILTEVMNVIHLDSVTMSLVMDTILITATWIRDQQTLENLKRLFVKYLTFNVVDVRDH